MSESRIKIIQRIDKLLNLANPLTNDNENERNASHLAAFKLMLEYDIQDYEISGTFEKPVTIFERGQRVRWIRWSSYLGGLSFEWWQDNCEGAKGTVVKTNYNNPYCIDVYVRFGGGMFFWLPSSWLELVEES